MPPVNNKQLCRKEQAPPGHVRMGFKDAVVIVLSFSPHVDQHPLHALPLPPFLSPAATEEQPEE